MIKYNWVITAMETAPSEGGLTDVVKTVHWRYQAQDAEYFADVYGSMGCATPSETDFTAYPDLTEDQVISWLDAGLDVESFKENLDEQIVSKKNPPIVSLPLPFAYPVI